MCLIKRLHMEWEFFCEKSVNSLVFMTFYGKILVQRCINNEYKLHNQ